MNEVAVSAYAALNENDDLKAYRYQLRLSENEVLVQITHSGVCHSDLHLIANDWGVTQFPLVPGHEVVGQIIALGANVPESYRDERVGVGWQSNSCGICEYCQHQDEHLCSSRKATCLNGFGGFADKIKVHYKFAHRIPSSISSEFAAPLMCAGLTAFSPLNKFITRPHMKVGIVGLGGIGHLAIQFATAMEANVSVFSSSTYKHTDAIKLGGRDFISLGESIPEKHLCTFDLIVCTLPTKLDCNLFLNLLKPKGVLCILGSLQEDLRVPIGPLLEQRSVYGSPIGSIKDMREMLAFSARHHIAPWVEVLPFDQINDAIDRARSNKAHYKLVLRMV